MKLVVDANVVISAIVKDAATRKLLFNPAFELYTPAYLFDELEEHREEIIRKSGLDPSQFKQFITLLGKVMEVLPARAYDAYIDEARTVLSDPDDMPYAACAIALTIEGQITPDADVIKTALQDEADLANATVHDVEECGIWTNDPHFTGKESEFLQRFGIKIWTTTDPYRMMKD